MYYKKVWFLVIPAVVAAALIFGSAVGYAIYLSTRTYDLMRGIDEYVGLRNYFRVVSDGDFWKALARNILYVIIVVSFNFIIGMGMALLCNEKFPANRLLERIIILPMLLFPAAGATLWKFIYHPEFGIINQLICAIGFNGKSWLGDPRTAIYAVMLTDIWSWTPWMFLVLLAGLRGLDRNVVEAALVDGASYWQRLRYVILPLMKPIIFVAVSLKAVDTFRTFDYVWVMTKGGPGGASHILSTYVYQTAFKYLQYGYGSALSIIVLLITMSISVPIAWYVMRRRL